MFTHTVESTVCDESPKKKVDDTQGRGTSHTVDSTVYVNIEKSGGLGWTCTIYRMCELGQKKS